MGATRSTAAWLLPGCIGVCAAAGSYLGPGATVPAFAPPDAHAVPEIVVVEGGTSAPELTVRSVGGGGLLVARSLDGPFVETGTDVLRMVAEPDKHRTERLVSIPTSVAWSHPMPGQPSAFLLHAAERRGDGSLGPLGMYTLPTVQHGLPVLSLSVPEASLFDPDTGIYVVGHAALHPSPEMSKVHQQDGRWWKYPGNFHFRGKEWERSGQVQLLGVDGQEVFQAPVRIRVNGQLTRGFPQHALRLGFAEALEVPVYPDGDGRGTRSLVLRAAGNDQMDALSRDALSRMLCAQETFMTARSLPCAVYINGAYWGIHQLQQRWDEREIARRFGVHHKDVAMLEMVNERFEGHADGQRLLDDLAHIAGLDPVTPDFLERIDERIDLEAFLAYMAAAMVLDNADWPHNNVRVWRYTGTPREAPLDGRWRFILNDMDLALGAQAGPSLPLFARIDRGKGPVQRLFKQVMMAPGAKRMFQGTVSGFAERAITPDRVGGAIDSLLRTMDPEMDRHVARWRRPGSTTAWQEEMARIGAYLEQRREHVARQVQ